MIIIKAFDVALPPFDVALPQRKIFFRRSNSKKKLNGKPPISYIPPPPPKMSSTTNMPNVTDMLATIASLETQLATLKIALGATDVSPPKSRGNRTKAEDGDSAKAARPPNAWIVFTSKVSEALKAASIATGAATVAKQFASSLKDTKPYDEWTDEAIVEAWSTWEKPEQSKRKTKADKSPSASDSGSEAVEPPKERKKRTPMTPEQKAAAKAKRDAKKVAAGPHAPLPVSEATSDAESVPAAAPAAAASLPTTKSTAKKLVAKYTLEQLADFDEFLFDDVTYGRNVRGDVVDNDFNFLGRWDPKNGKIDTSVEIPVDWASIAEAARK